MTYKDNWCDFSTRSILDRNNLTNEEIFNPGDLFDIPDCNNIVKCKRDKCDRKYICCSRKPRMSLCDPCIKYDPYFNIFNDINHSGIIGNCISPCSNGYCSYYRKPCFKFRNCDSSCDEILYSQYLNGCTPNTNNCYQPPIINFSKFIVQYLVSSPPNRKMPIGQKTLFSNCSSCSINPCMTNIQYSKGFGIPKVDENLIEPVGLVVVENTIWVANYGSGTITAYDVNGKILHTNILIQTTSLIKAHPTSIVYNPGPGFNIPNTNKLEPAFILVSTAEGTINGYNPNVNPAITYVLVDRSSVKAIYTSLALSTTNLFAVDINNNRVDVFDAMFNLVITFPFIDTTTEQTQNVEHLPEILPHNSVFKVATKKTLVIPETYRIYSIAYVKNKFYLFYALFNPKSPLVPIFGFGYGYVNVFDSNGKFIQRLQSNGVMDIPFGIYFTPSSFGFPVESYIIANEGDGLLNVFDSNNNLIGRLTDVCGNYIRIPALRAITTNPLYPNIIYFVASPNGNNAGLFGAISLSPFPC